MQGGVIASPVAASSGRSHPSRIAVRVRVRAQGKLGMLRRLDVQGRLDMQGRLRKSTP